MLCLITLICLSPAIASETTNELTDHQEEKQISYEWVKTINKRVVLAKPELETSIQFPEINFQYKPAQFHCPNKLYLLHCDLRYYE